MEILFTLLQIFLIILEYFFKPIIYLFSKDNVRVSKITDPILLMSAKKLAKEIRERRITSEEVVQAYINRIKEVDPIINAVVDRRFKQALLDAKEVDKYLKGHKNVSVLEVTKPLLGVPISVKESCSLKGMSFAVGSKSREGVISDEDGEAVKNLKSAGVIPLVVTNLPEFCLGFESINSINGITRNAYNASRSAAGSSGGEASLISAGGSIAGIGSDLAGSVRVPALFNGVFAHKPTPKIVPLKGHYPGGDDLNMHDYLVLGPIARYAEDLKILLYAMAKSNDKVLDLKLDEEVKLENLTVYFMEESGCKLFGFHRVQSEIKNKVKESVNYLQKQCRCLVSDHKFTDLKYSTEMCLATFANLESLPLLFGDPKNIWKSIFAEMCKFMVGRSKYTLFVIVYQALIDLKFFLPKSQQERYGNEAKKLRKELIRMLGINGVFLYPTFHRSAYQHFESGFALPYVHYCFIFNALGFPATHIPMGLDKEGLPIGIQVIAAPGQDRLCIAVAEELEKKFGGWVAPNP